MTAISFHTRELLTRQMILSLPESGGVIVVVTNEYGRWIKQGIAELRGKSLARRWKMITVCRRSSLQKLFGLPSSTMIDASIALLPRQLQDEIVMLVNGCRAAGVKP